MNYGTTMSCVYLLLTSKQNVTIVPKLFKYLLGIKTKKIPRSRLVTQYLKDNKYYAYLKNNNQ